MIKPEPCDYSISPYGLARHCAAVPHGAGPSRDRSHGERYHLHTNSELYCSSATAAGSAPAGNGAWYGSMQENGSFQADCSASMWSAAMYALSERPNTQISICAHAAHACPHTCKITPKCGEAACLHKCRPILTSRVPKHLQVWVALTPLLAHGTQITPMQPNTTPNTTPMQPQCNPNTTSMQPQHNPYTTGRLIWTAR